MYYYTLLSVYLFCCFILYYSLSWFLLSSFCFVKNVCNTFLWRFGSTAAEFPGQTYLDINVHRYLSAFWGLLS